MYYELTDAIRQNFEDQHIDPGAAEAMAGYIFDGRPVDEEHFRTFHDRNTGGILKLAEAEAKLIAQASGGELTPAALARQRRLADFVMRAERRSTGAGVPPTNVYGNTYSAVQQTQMFDYEGVHNGPLRMHRPAPPTEQS